MALTELVSNRRSGALAGAVVALVAAAICGAVFWPSGADDGPTGSDISAGLDTSLDTSLDALDVQATETAAPAATQLRVDTDTAATPPASTEPAGSDAMSSDSMTSESTTSDSTAPLTDDASTTTDASTESSLSTTSSADTASTTSETSTPGTSTPETSTSQTTLADSSTTETSAATPAGGTGYQSCRVPSGGQEVASDFAAARSAGQPVADLNRGSLNGNDTFVRAVFELGPDRMRWGADGVELSVDIADDRATNNRYRAELRETRIDQPIPVGSTQAYCMRFRVDALPDLYGPVHIFQRFNRDIDGPDIGVELTGANQFSNAVPNDIQVVGWDGRHRIGRQLEAVNTLMVVVFNHATNGSYKVVLNGQTLRAGSGLNTVGAAGGGWSQFGLYPHGLYDDDGSNRSDQLASGRTRVQFEYRDFAITNYETGSSDLSGFGVG